MSGQPTVKRVRLAELMAMISLGTDLGMGQPMEHVLRQSLIALRLAESPVTDPGRLAGEGTIDQVLGDLAELRLLGADTVVLDPFSGDPRETLRPEDAWQTLATVWARTRHLREQP